MAWIRNRPVGLVHRDPDRSWPGYTLFCPIRGTTANLLDPAGRIVWRWQHPEGIQHAKLAPDGNLLIQTQPPQDAEGLEQIGGSAAALVELDWDSKLVWEHRDPHQHHDYQRLPNGNHLLLSWRKLPDGVQEQIRGGFQHRDDPERMWGDVVQEIGREGDIVRQWRSWEHLCFEQDVRCPLESRKEWTHANSIECLPDGRWLLSFRLTNTLAIVEPESGRIEWRWGPGILSHQHAASWLESGRVLVFDNGCHRRGLPSFSQLLEIDPETNEIAWTYRPAVVLSFFSFMAGGADRLAGGNTLVTEAASGRIFEVTPAGDTVWEYVSPFTLIDPRFGPTPAVFRAHRYAADHPSLAGRDLTPGRHEALERKIAAAGLAVGEE